MMHRVRQLHAAAISLAAASLALAQATDSRVREVAYESGAVVEIPVKRGVVTDIVLGADEAITDVASGLGADCARPDDVWCIAVKPGARHLFVKPKSAASAPNTLAVITDKRAHSFRLVVLEEGDARMPAYRLSVMAPGARAQAAAATAPLLDPVAPALPALAPPSEAVIAERLQAAPQIANSSYSAAVGRASDDIAPTLVFDDGRFTYLRFPGNRELPAVFEVRADSSESLVNARMEGDLLVVDRVARRLVLRAGTAVVGIWNDAFDIDGIAPVRGTTVPGVERIVRTSLPTGLAPVRQQRSSP
jgi:type IV secretion system protein VirB9